MGRSILLFLGLAAGAAGAAPLAVVGFNVESGDASDHVIAVQLENSVGVDLWGVVDVWDEGGWPQRLREGAAVGEPAAFGAVLGKSGGDSRLMVLYREDRLVPLEYEEITDAQVSARLPAPLAVRFRLDGEDDFWFLVADLSSSDGRRRSQARALAEWTARRSLPIVATGTFRFGAEADGSEDPAMGDLLDAGWRWIRPVEPVGTACGRGGRMDDLVFLAGPGEAWGARAEVMYPQSNYCPDNGRTSSHRPVLANLDPAGDPPVITGSMPERQVRPFLPDRLAGGGPETPQLANEPVFLVEPDSPAPDAGTVGQPAAEGGANRTGGADRQELLRRLEALEVEAERLRREIEAGAR